MIATAYIGSGDIGSLLMGRETKGFLALLQRFVSDEVPIYNAEASPIDALRTGAILEKRFYMVLDDSWFYQYHVQSDEMDVFKATLDFAKLEAGEVVDFIELKTISFNDYITQIEPIKDDNNALVQFLQKKHRAYYNQVQEQLYCSRLERAHLAFLSVTSYDDEENKLRVIKPNEYTMVEIERDDEIIDIIRERGHIFQLIKDELKK